MELQELLVEYDSIIKNKKDFGKKMINDSVIKWIFYTNRIEYSGYDTEEDTKNALLKITSGEAKKNKEVNQLFAVLAKSYNNNKKNFPTYI